MTAVKTKYIAMLLSILTATLLVGAAAASFVVHSLDGWPQMWMTAAGIIVTLFAVSALVLDWSAREVLNQELLLVLPLSPTLSLATALVLLSDGDGKVYRYVTLHGGKQARGGKNETRIRYAGKPIYDAKRRRFVIDGWAYRPRSIKVYVTNREG